MAQKQLHPGAKWLFRVNAFFTLLFLSIFLGIWVGAFFMGFLTVFRVSMFSAFLFTILIWIVTAIVLIEVFARLSYRFWKYEFADSQLRIERGIIWKKYSNIPYERMQNIDITRGIIARILGFSTVNIQTAGYSGHSGRGHGTFSEGHIPAVDVKEAEKIREFIIKKITKKRGRSGL